MPKLILSGSTIEVPEGKTVLEALLESGVEVPYSCQAGVCQTCKMQAIEGEIPPEAQDGLLDTERAENYFLACVARPTSDLSLRLPTERRRFRSEILELERITPEVLILRLKQPEGYRYRSGQFLRLYREEASRCYSLASLPEEPFLELHIKKISGGRFSSWLFERADRGEKVEIGEAEGSCFYLAGEPDRPLLLAGTGTGLAPLYGIVRAALRQGHRGEIFLYHGAPSPSELYLHEKLQRLAFEHENFHYLGCVLEGEGEGMVRGRLEEVIAERHPELKGWRCHFCGNPKMVEALKMKAFLAGAALKAIYSDPFLPSS